MNGWSKKVTTNALLLSRPVLVDDAFWANELGIRWSKLTSHRMGSIYDTRGPKCSREASLRHVRICNEQHHSQFMFATTYSSSTTHHLSAAHLSWKNTAHKSLLLERHLPYQHQDSAFHIAKWFMDWYWIPSQTPPPQEFTTLSSTALDMRPHTHSTLIISI